MERLTEDIPTIVGIDHGFSFPLRYFEVHHLEPDWPSFLDDFHQHWPTDDQNTYGSLATFLKPHMLPGEYHVAHVEGWILGML